MKIDIQNVDVQADYVNIYKIQDDLVIEIPCKTGFYDLRIKTGAIAIDRNLEIVDLESYHNVIKCKED